MQLQRPNLCEIIILLNTQFIPLGFDQISKTEKERWEYRKGRC
jgi:hypothetical protein